MEANVVVAIGIGVVIVVIFAVLCIIGYFFAKAITKFFGDD